MHPHVRNKGNWPVESGADMIRNRIAAYGRKSSLSLGRTEKKTLRGKGIRSWNLRLRPHLGAATVGRASDCSSAAALPSRRLSHPRPWTRPGPVCPPRPALRRSELPLHRDCAKPVPRLRSNRPRDKPLVASAPVTHRRSFRTRI